MALSLQEQETLAICRQLILENEQNGGSPEETARIKQTVDLMLNVTFGIDMPFYSSESVLKEFRSFQPATVNQLLKIEEGLFEAGDEAGTGIFKDALAEFLQLEKDQLLVLEKEETLFLTTFRNEYLMKHAERLFEEIAEFFNEMGISTKPHPINTIMGQIQSNSVYPLYTHLYESATKEQKRTLQSLLQKRNVTLKSLKKASQVKKRKSTKALDVLSEEEMKRLFPE